MNSRTNFRLQLQRELSIQEQNKKYSQPRMLSNNSISFSSSATDSANSYSSVTSNNNIESSAIKTAPIAIAGRPIKDHQPKSMPVIISQPIRFNGNRLVHMPPQIIHVQQQQQVNSSKDSNNTVAQQATIANSSTGHKITHSSVPLSSANNIMTLSSSFPAQQQPTNKMVNKVTGGQPNRINTTPSNFGFSPQHHYQQVRTSRQSYSELSPTETIYADSPCSASFTSAQSELDDVIIDEILSMEEEQQRRSILEDNNDVKLQHKLVSSLSYADDLEGLLTIGARAHSHSSFGQQRQVSNSAPSASVDIEGLVREELSKEQELMRDRRKKDVHNMIERRRRYNINDRIKELGTLLPKSCTEEMKLNKGTILQASVEYIFELRRDRERLIHMQQKQNVLEDENRRMQKRIQDLEERLRINGITLPSPYEPLSPSQADFHSKLIKTEPVEEEVEMTNVVGHHVSIPNKMDPYSPSPSDERSSSQTPPSSSSATTGGGGAFHHSTFEFSQPPAGCRDFSNTGANHEIYGFNSLPTTQYHNNPERYFVRETKLENQIHASPSSELDDHSSQGRNNRLVGGNVPNIPPSNFNPHESPYNVTSLNPNLHDFMMELSGADVLTTSCDPMMSDTGLLLGASQVSSPDILWESGAFSPEGGQNHGHLQHQQHQQHHQQQERMDFVTT